MAAVDAMDSGSAASLPLLRSISVQSIVAVIVICFCTRVLSEFQFRNHKSSRGRQISPPTLPHWIPWLRHGLSMGWSARSFIASCLNKYGCEEPFYVDGAGQKVLILQNPKHVKQVLRSANACDPNPFVHDEIMHQLMGSPQAAVNYYKTPGTTVDHDQMVQVRQLCSGSALPALDNRMFDVLKRNITNACAPAKDGEWTDIPDLYGFFQHHATRTVGEILLGSDVVEKYPGLAEDMWSFIDGTDRFLMGLPNFLNAKAYATRARLLKHFRQLSQNHDNLNEKKALNGEWHPVAGSILMQEREKWYPTLPDHDLDARASQTLGIFYASTSILVPVTFWLCYETMRTPKLLDRVTTELNATRDPTSQRYDTVQLCATPFLHSLHAETARSYGNVLPTRRTIVPSFALDEQYVVPQGTTIMMPSTFAGQYTPGWSSVRPSLVEKPLDTFWPERFLTDRTPGQERFSDAGLLGALTPFGGGAHHCPGRFWARNIGIVMLAVLIGEFEIEIKDVEAARAFDPVWHDTVFGTAKPKGKIAARLRRRV